MTLVHGEDWVHARWTVIVRSGLVSCLRGLAVIVVVWTAVAGFSALSLSLRLSSGEITLPPGWYLRTLALIPIWTVLTLPVLALSRRFPLERRAWRSALVVHAAALLAVLAVDGLINMIVSPSAGNRPLTFWQQMWRYSFIDAFFYASIVLVDHAGRYYRLYLDRRVRASALEAQLSRAQLQALQMQIRPHFLFNTLNTISGLVRIDDKPAAIAMLAGLGDLLRMLLHSDGAQEVPVRQELELIERYLAIEQVRFGDQLSIEVVVEPGVEDALVPNLILQPLVENAVRHGVGDASGRVAVRAQRLGATVRLEVYDSGDAGRRSLDRVGIGLGNTLARLDRMYNGAHRFDLVQSAAGTSAILEIPFHQGART